MPTAQLTAPAAPPTLSPLGISERRAYLELSDLNADKNGMMQIAANTLKRLLAQVAAQEQQLLLHERREKGLRELGAAWQTEVAGLEDYQDAGMELMAVLNDANYGDPAYADQDPEHDGQGWRVARPTLRSNL